MLYIFRGHILTME